jgi:hypothetical protein
MFWSIFIQSTAFILAVVLAGGAVVWLGDRQAQRK